MCVTLTASAAQFMKRMIRFGGAGAGAGFRLTVTPGGCSGFNSSFSIEPAPLPGDSVLDDQGVRLFLEEKSCELLRGYTVDFTETRMDGGLAFSNPNAGPMCGCGSGGGQKPATATVAFVRKATTCEKA